MSIAQTLKFLPKFYTHFTLNHTRLKRILPLYAAIVRIRSKHLTELCANEYHHHAIINSTCQHCYNRHIPDIISSKLSIILTILHSSNPASKIIQHISIFQYLAFIPYAPDRLDIRQIRQNSIWPYVTGNLTIQYCKIRSRYAR